MKPRFFTGIFKFSTRAAISLLAASIAVRQSLPESRVKGSNMPHTILRLPAVQAAIGLSRSTIYLRIAEGTFPKPVSLGARAVGWLQSDIEEWLRQRIELSGTQA